MNGDKFRDALDWLQISQLAAGRLLQIEGRQIRRMVAGTAEVPYAVAVLLRLALRGKIKIADIETASAPPPDIIEAPFLQAVMLRLALKGKVTIKDIINASKPDRDFG